MMLRVKVTLLKVYRSSEAVVIVLAANDFER